MKKKKKKKKKQKGVKEEEKGLEEGLDLVRDVLVRADVHRELSAGQVSAGQRRTVRRRRRRQPQAGC